MTTPGWLVVANKAPFNIMAASPEFPEFLEYEIHEIVGRSMRMLFGPMTNVAELRKAVVESATTQSFCACFMLYTKNGQGRMLVVEIVPAHNGQGDATHCVMTVDHADGVPKKVAVAEDTRAKLVLKADKPYAVECVSQHFAKLYDLSSDALTGRTLRPIFGPRTDAQSFDQALVLAKAGKTQNISLWTCKADMSNLLVNITVFPVAEQGVICNFMLVFKGAIDVKSTTSTEGAKCGPPVKRVRPASMRLAASPQAPQDCSPRTSSEPEAKKQDTAGVGGVAEPGGVSGAHTAAAASPIATTHAERVRQHLEQREGGVERLIQAGCAVMEDLGDEAGSGGQRELAPAGGAGDGEGGIARVPSDDDDAAGMAFAEPLKA